MVNEAATVTGVTLVDKDGTTISKKTMTWLNHELAAGMYVSAGAFPGTTSDLYISSITLSGGSILLYLD